MAAIKDTALFPPPPHGGRLVDRTLVPGRAAEELSRAASLPALRLDARALADLYLLAVGAYSPLEGFVIPSSVLIVVVFPAPFLPRKP